MQLFIQQLFVKPMEFFIWILVVVFSICCHEYAHARVALWQGDPTAAERGHLTLNPLRQMGIFSLIMLAFVGIAWGAVPVNPYRMRHKYSAAIVAFAGPLMNIILFVLFSIGLAVVKVTGGNEAALLLFGVGAVLNVVLFLFNMLPVPPLDGWGVLNGCFPKLRLENSELAKGSIVLLMLLVFIGGFRYIFTAGNFITIHFVQLILTVLKMFGIEG